MIKFLAGIAYKQNQPKGVASALIVQFGVLVKSALKMHFTKKKKKKKKKSDQKIVSNHNTQLLVQNVLIAAGVWSLP